jgi:hypothetical protein
MRVLSPALWVQRVGYRPARVENSLAARDPSWGIANVAHVPLAALGVVSVALAFDNTAGVSGTSLRERRQAVFVS